MTLESGSLRRWRNTAPDRVPVAPDISNYIPASARDCRSGHLFQRRRATLAAYLEICRGLRDGRLDGVGDGVPLCV